MVAGKAAAATVVSVLTGDEVMVWYYDEGGGGVVMVALGCWWRGGDRFVVRCGRDGGEGNNDGYMVERQAWGSRCVLSFRKRRPGALITLFVPISLAMVKDDILERIHLFSHYGHRTLAHLEIFKATISSKATMITPI
nr:hypothetical protein [Tanacetum cinerariifolium]